VCYRLSIGVHWTGWLPGWHPPRQQWVAASRSGLTACYVHREIQTVTYPAKGCTQDVQALRKASTEASNLSKGEMCFNLSLSISFYVSTLQLGSRIWGHHVSSSPSRAPVYFRLRRPTRGASSGGTTCSLCFALYAIMIHRIVLQFYVCFCISLFSCGRLLFLCSASCSSCATLSWADLLEVPASYLDHLVIFLPGVPCC
jgi:hypothetical protein